MLGEPCQSKSARGAKLKEGRSHRPEMEVQLGQIKVPLSSLSTTPLSFGDPHTLVLLFAFFFQSSWIHYCAPIRMLHHGRLRQKQPNVLNDMCCNQDDDDDPTVFGALVGGHLMLVSL